MTSPPGDLSLEMHGIRFESMRTHLFAYGNTSSEFDDIRSYGLCDNVHRTIAEAGLEAHDPQRACCSIVTCGLRPSVGSEVGLESCDGGEIIAEIDSIYQ